MFSRIVYAARISLYVGLISVVIATLAGLVIGIGSGYVGGALHLEVQRVMDAITGFPPLLLALILVVP